ncbi:unnamed protein product [Symbiodinium natans]|uniref:Calnexin n=1 Tax=Symbiodinium natans TaxID=878477 RepID=A0A812PI70_9DINO|nr:unnamed protein product [Symbiodinium natans]
MADPCVQETITTPYVAPDVAGFHFAETFDADVWSRWKHSAAEKYNGKFEVTTRTPEALVGDVALQVPEAARHYGAVKFAPIAVKEQGSFALQLLGRGYIIMFGPDKCGATNKVHFIFQHKNPVSGKWEEKHLQTPPGVPMDRRSHLYGLFIRSDNSFEVHVDGEKKASGSLLKDMQPPVNPPKEIDDPSDQKPSDWIDDAKMDDPDASKPDDWDEDAPFQIPDPSASMPSGWLEDELPKIPDPKSQRPGDWDDEEDGEWEAPIIDNPKCSVGCGKWEAPKISNPNYKGKWYAPKIDNPAYVGEWKPRQIDNPEYFVDESPYMLPAIDSVGIDIWTMDKGIMFDNIVIDSSPEKVMAFGQATFKVRSEIEAKQALRAASLSFISQRIMFSTKTAQVLDNPVPVLITLVVSC